MFTYAAALFVSRFNTFSYNLIVINGNKRLKIVRREQAHIKTNTQRFSLALKKFRLVHDLFHRR